MEDFFVFRLTAKDLEKQSAEKRDAKERVGLVEPPLRQSHLWKATKLVGRLISVCKQLMVRHT